MANLWGTLAGGSGALFTWVGLALLAAVLWGLQYALWGQALKAVSPVVGMWWYCLISMVLYTVFVWARGIDIGAAAMAINWPLMGLLVVIAILGFAGNVTMLSGFKMANPTVVTMITASAPLFSAFFAYLFFRNVDVNLMTILGFVMILGGVGVVAYSRG